MNTNGNGHDKDHEEEEERIIRFPSLAERDRIRRDKEDAEKEKKKAPSVPFFNFARVPMLTRVVIALFLLVHLPLYLLVDASTRLEIFYSFGFVPGVYTGAAPWEWTALIAPLTHIFIHGGWFHLALNSAMMLVMGLFIETVFGTKRMLIFFLFSGLCGAIFCFILAPFSVSAVVGASGSISGLFGVTILVLYEQGRLGAGGRRGALPLLLFWVALMVGMGLLGGGIAWQAHLGGFLGALGLFYALRKNWIRF